ncbi:MAG: putative membrane protein, partial [Planctomycetota bacterium]
MPLKMKSTPNSKRIFSLLGKLLVSSLFVAIPFYSSFAQVFGQTIPDFWLWQFLGRLHPMIVHFPIALLIFAAVLELVTIRKYNSRFRPGIHLLVLIGAISAVIAAMFGWLLANSDGIQGELLDLHQKLGIATAILSLLVLFFLQKVGKKPLPNQIKLFRTSLFIACLGVSVSGHFGASLTHGEEFLTEMLPWNEEFDAPESLTINLAEFTSDLSENQEMLLVTNVRSVLAHNCYKCHSGSKIKGELRLDEKEYIFKGGENGPIISPGNPSQSELIRRVSLSKNHKDVMPSKGKSLSKEEISLLTLWIEKGALWPDGVPQQSLYRVADLAPRKPSLPAAKAGLENPIDRWVDHYFKANEIDWNVRVDDRTFLRRIYLDVIGLLPSPEDLERFQEDPNPQKRQAIAQQLLDQKEDYTQHWMTFWNDILRNDYTGTGYITKGRFAITDWLYTSIRDNKAYDTFVKELLNPTEKSKGFIEGIRWRGTVNASQRIEMQAAQNVGQVILGLNLKCASCHDSFI